MGMKRWNWDETFRITKQQGNFDAINIGTMTICILAGQVQMRWQQSQGTRIGAMTANHLRPKGTPEIGQPQSGWNVSADGLRLVFGAGLWNHGGMDASKTGSGLCFLR
jgi:hypothetical protein